MNSVVSNPAVTLIRDEYELMSDVVCSSARTTPGIALLSQEIERAVRVGADEAPADVVRLHSTVTFTQLATGEPRTVRIAPAGEGRPDGDAVSVSSELGAALIGLRPGDRFAWRDEAGARRSLRIDRVEQDPVEQGRRRDRDIEARRRAVKDLLSIGDD